MKRGEGLGSRDAVRNGTRIDGMAGESSRGKGGQSSWVWARAWIYVDNGERALGKGVAKCFGECWVLGSAGAAGCARKKAFSAAAGTSHSP